MDTLYGLIRYLGSWLRLLAFPLLPFILAFVVVGQVHAAGPFTMTGVSGSYPTPLAACQAYIAAFHPSHTAGTSGTYPGPYMCQRSGVNWQSINGTYPTCTAPQVYDDEIGSCVTPVVCEDGRILDSGFYSSANNPIACISGCTALRVSEGAPHLDCSFSDVGTCAYVYPARYVDTGEACSPSDAPVKETPEPDCPACRCMESGGSWGQVGGVDACVPQGSAGSAPVTKPSAPPKVTTTTPAPTPENPDPEPVTEVTPAPVITVTPPPAGSPAGTPPTVTETTTDQNGGTVQTETDKKTFCEENPTSQICRDDDKSIFNGSCAAGFHCEGDAIQCSIAKEQYQRNCQIFKDVEIYAPAFEQAKLEADSLSPSHPSNHVVVNIPSELDASTPFSRECPADIEFTLFGQVFTLPISNWCPYLAFVGDVFLALAYLYGARSLIGSL